MDFEFPSLNNNKTNSLIKLSYSLRICSVATEGSVITLGTRAMSQTQLPCCHGTLRRILSDGPNFTVCLQPFPAVSFSISSVWLLACFSSATMPQIHHPSEFF